jgi:hypothetical protein
MRIQTSWSFTKIVMIPALAFVGMLIFFYWTYKDRNIPRQLIGDWNTSDPNYSDRYFNIGPTTISFTTGNGTVSTGWIKEIKTVQTGVSTLYIIEYDVNGTANELSFYYETKKPKASIIRFKNQKNTIWTKIDKHPV